MAVEPELEAIITAFAERKRLIREHVVAYITRIWGSLEAFRDDDIEQFVSLVAPAVEAGQIQMAALSDAYLATVEASVLGTPVRPVGIPREAVTQLRGLPTKDVYHRAGETVWRALANGDELPSAAQKGLSRAVKLAETDLQQAKTTTSKLVMSTKGQVVGYRRVLTGSKSCALCVVASTQRYRKKNLMPCHPGCDCDVLPIYGDKDPGQVIDPDRLEGLHDLVSSQLGYSGDQRSAKGYKDLIVTHEHGEFGPTLARRGDEVTRPKDLGRKVVAQEKRKIESEKRWEENLAAARKSGGTVQVDPATLKAKTPAKPTPTPEQPATPATKAPARKTPARKNAAIEKRKKEAQKRWDENLAAARRNGGVVQVDPDTLRVIETN